MQPKTARPQMTRQGRIERYPVPLRKGVVLAEEVPIGRVRPRRTGRRRQTEQCIQSAARERQRLTKAIAKRKRLIKTLSQSSHFVSRIIRERHLLQEDKAAHRAVEGLYHALEQQIIRKLSV